MVLKQESKITTCECDTDSKFVPTQNGCMCMSGLYWLVDGAENKCVDAAECNANKKLIDERTRRCVSSPECEKLGKLASLDGKFCRVLGDPDCEPTFDNKQCGCSKFVSGTSCVSECGLFEPRHPKGSANGPTA